MEPPRPSLTSPVGQVLDDRYQLTALLGEGGMGAVYRARTRDGQEVAVKLLHEALEGEPELRERFEREARALFGLQHPNILAVHDFGVHAGKPYLVMELLEGKGLDTLVEDGPLDPGRAFALFRQALEGLAHAHAQGVLHRDLKTENIHVTQLPDGREVAKLLDFGLVKFVDDDRWGQSKKLTVQGSVFGTPAYMPPEQCAGAPTDAKSDVYSMGVILFELMTGLWPFMEEDRMAMFQAHLTKPVPALSGSRDDGLMFRQELEAVLQRSMQKLASKRFPNAVEMLAALDAVPKPIAALPAPAAAPAPPAAVAPAVERKGAPVLLIAAVVGVIVVLAVAAFALG
ncbi:MAG: serine/threonine-protein kinase [Myxococcota bacterium]